MTRETVPARPMPERFKAVTLWLFFPAQETPIQVQIDALEVADQFDKMPERSMMFVLIARREDLSSVGKQRVKQLTNNNDETTKMR